MIRRAVLALSIVACGGSAVVANATSPVPDDPDVIDSGNARDASASSRDASVDAAPVPPVACGTELPGPPLKAGLTESEPGFADDLAAVDIDTIPDPLDYSGEAAFNRGVINWMLDRSEGTSVTHEEALAHPMGRAVLASATSGRPSVTFLRRALYYYSACSRPVPADLAGLVARYGDYTTWPDVEIACSKPKNGPRRIHQGDGIFVAETLFDDGGVRETEVLFQNLRTDGQLDFAVYEPDGRLGDRSTFASGGGNSVVSAAPYTCMTCHRDTTTGAFTVLFPSGLGAGCAQ